MSHDPTHDPTVDYVHCMTCAQGLSNAFARYGYSRWSEMVRLVETLKRLAEDAIAKGAAS